MGSGEIEQKDIDDLLNTAMSVTLPPSMRYLDVIPQEYSADYARRIRTPIGMEGKKLRRQSARRDCAERSVPVPQ